MKREPQISDGVLDSVARKHGEPIDEPEYCGGPILYAAMDIMSIYEELIDRGTLRVVEEVELEPNGSTDDGHGGVVPLYTHKNCPGPYHEIRGYDGSSEVDATCCPGCGGRIKQA